MHDAAHSSGRKIKADGPVTGGRARHKPPRNEFYTSRVSTRQLVSYWNAGESSPEKLHVGVVEAGMERRNDSRDWLGQTGLSSRKTASSN